MAVSKKTLVSRDKRAAIATPMAAKPAPRLETVAYTDAASLHQIVAKKLAVAKLVTAKRFR